MQRAPRLLRLQPAFLTLEQHVPACESAVLRASGLSKRFSSSRIPAAALRCVSCTAAQPCSVVARPGQSQRLDGSRRLFSHAASGIALCGQASTLLLRQLSRSSVCCSAAAPSAPPLSAEAAAATSGECSPFSKLEPRCSQCVICVPNDIHDRTAPCKAHCTPAT